MLNMQNKINRFNAPTQFNVSQDDAAEFNSSMDEIKNAVEDQGGILTPATDPAYLNDDTHQLNKSIIAGGGWIMPTDSVTDALVTFTADAAGVNNFPPIAQFQGKVLQFITASSPSTGAYEVDYEGVLTSDLLDLSGNPLLPGQLPADVVAEIFYNGTNWRLKNTTINVTSDTLSYTIVPGDVAAISGIFTLTSGQINWFIQGKKIWVYFNIFGVQTVADTSAINVDVTTNTSLPLNPWTGMGDACMENLKNTPDHFSISDLAAGFRIKKMGSGDITQSTYQWRGSFFYQLP